MKTHPKLLGPKRRLVQLLLATSFFLAPFLQLKERGLLWVNLPELTIDLFWQRFQIEELQLFVPLILGLIFLFIFITLVLGRVWCGWCCPQTSFSDLADFLLSRLKLKATAKRHKPSSLLLLHLVYLGVSLLFGATVVWYFVPPLTYGTRLINGDLGVWPLATTVVITGLSFLNLTFLRRLFCKEFCPYGRFQTILMDSATLTLQAHPAHIERCIDCGSCQRVCPTGIDIRNGFQIECINCAQCLDACRKVMAARGQSGIIRYTFGPADLSWRSLVQPKFFTIAAIALLLLGTFFVRSTHRAPVIFEIGRSTRSESRLLTANQQMTFFSGFISNRSPTKQTYTISARQESTFPLRIKGATEYVVNAGDKQAFNIALLSAQPPDNNPLPVTIILSANQVPVVTQNAFIAALRKTRSQYPEEHHENK